MVCQANVRRAYAEEEVTAFLQKFDSINLERMSERLQQATKRLESVPEHERGINALQDDNQTGLYALFEVLHSDAALENADFLAKYFDRPFLLVQTKKRLKLNQYTPAVGHFLFHHNQERNVWAVGSWARFRRNISAIEFEWSVREPLSRAMTRISLADLDLNFLPTFWAGIRCIIEKLDADLITHSLRALQPDVCRLALDHLQVNSNSFQDVLQSMKRIFELCPEDFWEAMHTTPATVWVEQFAGSKALSRILKQAQEKAEPESQLKKMFDWIPPFMSSIKPVHQASACRALVDFLLRDIQEWELDNQVKRFCFDMGFKVLTTTLEVISAERISSTARSNIKEILDVVQRHLKPMIDSIIQSSELADTSARLLSQAIALEVQCLSNDRNLLSLRRPLPEHACEVHQSLWDGCCQGDAVNDLLFAKHLIKGSKALVGLEKFPIKNQENNSYSRFNDALDALNNFVAEVLERISETDAGTLQTFFDDEDTSNALIAQLSSSDESVRSATIEIIKTTSGQTVRKEALGDALGTYFEGILNGYSLSLRRLSYKVTFAPASSMLRVCKDFLDVLCNSSNGLLRVATMSKPGIAATENFWQTLWLELRTIFSSTEEWSNMGHDKSEMITFCGDVMEFAGMLFDQFGVFEKALFSADKAVLGEGRTAGQYLNEQPKSTLGLMIKFLRLRDDFLLSKSVALVCDVLRRLKQFDTLADSEALTDIESAIIGRTRTVLSDNQKAELHRALEDHAGTAVAFTDEPLSKAKTDKKYKSGVINLDKWQSQAKEQGFDSLDSVISSASKAQTAFKERRMPQPTGRSSPVPSLIKNDQKKGDPTEFARKRQEELAAKKRRDAEAIAKMKAKQGSKTLDGLGAKGIDHSIPKGEGAFVSDDESEDDESEDEMDKMLFGGSTKPSLTAEERKKRDEAKAKKKAQAQPRGPVKKQRLVRSAKDMRARLAPDLAPLHKHILSWDPNHDGSFPPKAGKNDYASVVSTFRDPVTYQNTFQPLLLLEAWNGFLKSKEENTAAPIEMKILNRSSVDAFAEVTASMDQKDRKEFGEGDIVLISRTSSAFSDSREPKCLSRVMKIIPKKTHFEILYRTVPGSSMTSALNPNSKAYFLKIMPIVPLEREYGALLGLQYYDLCEEITTAKPSPLLSYKDESLTSTMTNYIVNPAQARAVKSALDNDAFTLIQGPPGSGKTKTIVAIVGALLTPVLQKGGVTIMQPAAGHPQSRAPSRKMLICAPSNAAVDELVMRFKEGVKTTDGRARAINIVRLGRSDAINANVRDVTLEDLVDKRLNKNTESQAKDETHKIMKQHQEVSQKLREARQRLDKDDTTENRRAMEELKKSKAVLSQRVDSAKDNEGMQSRQAELNKRKVQQEIIEESHIICATLSGSGHDMFQNLNVEFETVIIDEAAQCVELSALIPLKYGCAKCILVGDPQQLPPTVFSKEAANFKYEQSLFVRMQSNHPQAVHLLDTQYRMHPSISHFPSQAFYEGKLKDGPDMAKLRTRPWHAADLTGPFQFFDVQGQHSSAPQGHSLVNNAEIRVALQLYKRLTTDFNQDFSRKVGIITPYKSQLRLLKQRFEDVYGKTITTDVEFNTTDAFQGRESEIIIFSCVRASPAGGIGFLQDIRRMNVGLTRAKSSLWVLGNSQSLVKGQYWRKLVEHAKSSKHFVEGNIEALLQKPLRKTHKVDAPSAGEKMPKLETMASSDDQSESSSKRASDAMDLDHEDEKPAARTGSVKKEEEKESRSMSAMPLPTKRKHDNANGRNSSVGSATPISRSSATPVEADVEMKERSSSDNENEVEAKKVRSEEKPRATSASNAVRPQGVTKKPVIKKKKKEASVFMPSKPRK